MTGQVTWTDQKCLVESGSIPTKTSSHEKSLNSGKALPSWRTLGHKLREQLIVDSHWMLHSWTMSVMVVVLDAACQIKLQAKLKQGEITGEDSDFQKFAWTTKPQWMICSFQKRKQASITRDLKLLAHHLEFLYLPLPEECSNHLSVSIEHKSGRLSSNSQSRTTSVETSSSQETQV